MRGDWSNHLLTLLVFKASLQPDNPLLDFLFFVKYKTQTHVVLQSVLAGEQHPLSDVHFGGLGFLAQVSRVDLRQADPEEVSPVRDGVDGFGEMFPQQ